MVWIKRVNNADSGDATHWGGDNIDNIDKYFDNTDISASIINPTKINTPTTYKDGKLKFRNAGDTFSYTLKSGTLSADVDLTLPSLGANGTLIASGGPNDWTALQTFRDDLFKIMNPANTFGYIHSTSAIVADRIITWPLLSANDEVLMKDFAQTPINKTINIDTNAIKHSTTNANADILVFENSSGRYDRLARGTAGQVLKVEPGGAFIQWEAESSGTSASYYDDLKTSSGFKYGTWSGIFQPSDAPDVGGDGLFSDMVNIGGVPAAYIDTTNGFQGVSYPMTGSGDNRGFMTVNPITIRKINPDLTVAFQLDEGGDTTGSRVWIGFTNNLTAGSLIDSSYLDNDIGFMLQKSSTETFFKITSNDGDATQDSTGSILSSDSNFHTIRLFATEASTKWSYSLDGAAPTDITLEIPGATDQLGVVFNASQSDSTSRNFRLFWARLKMKERA